MSKYFKRYLQRNLIRDIINNANIRNNKKMFGMAFLLLVKLFLSYIIRQKQWQLIGYEVINPWNMFDIYYC